MPSCSNGGCRRPVAEGRKSCPRCLERSRAYYHRNREKANTARCLAKYGMTQEQYDALLAEQGGGCAICGGSSCTRYARLSVDHCHTSGRVRGLLCNNCNRAIGLLKDDPEMLILAAGYLASAA